MSDVVTPRPPLGCAAVMMGLFRAALQEHRLPVTQQREAIARTLFESARHVSADEVAERLRERGEQVGKATVYRTLNLLVEVGLAAEHDFDEGFKRYEPRVGPAHHDHLICTSCGEVVEFHRNELDQLQHEVATPRGFRVLTRQLKLYGLCAACDSEAGEALRRAG
ncbi:MAG: Fur family transcriptional regulator [Gemmatimonadota bacterium]